MKTVDDAYEAGSGAAPAAPAEPLLEATALQFERSEGFTLSVPEMSIHPGEVLGVIGANGSGKSSLLACLLGTVEPRYERLRVLGNPAGRLAPAARQTLGMQLQGAGYNDLYLVRDLQRLHALTYGRSDPRVFEAFGIPALAARRYGRISSGEQQRVQLAMALAHHPTLALFDEPTSNLDPAYEEQFCATLRARRAAGGFGTLLITHAPHVVSLCDRLMILDKGRVDALGAPMDLVKARFDEVACRIVPSGLQPADALNALRHAAVRSTEKGRSLVLYGGAALRRAALEYLQRHPAESCSLWRPNATDLLEGIKNG